MQHIYKWVYTFKFMAPASTDPASKPDICEGHSAALAASVVIWTLYVCHADCSSIAAQPPPVITGCQVRVCVAGLCGLDAIPQVLALATEGRTLAL